MVKKAVMAAVDTGYRHIDCAYDYQNYEEVGEGIRAKIADGTITRDDIFYTDKVSLNNNICVHILSISNSYSLFN